MTKGKYTDTAYMFLLCRRVENNSASRYSEAARGHQSLWPTLTEITTFNNIRNLMSNFLLFERSKIT